MSTWICIMWLKVCVQMQMQMQLQTWTDKSIEVRAILPILDLCLDLLLKLECNLYPIRDRNLASFFTFRHSTSRVIFVVCSLGILLSLTIRAHPHCLLVSFRNLHTLGAHLQTSLQ